MRNIFVVLFVVLIPGCKKPGKDTDFFRDYSSLGTTKEGLVFNLDRKNRDPCSAYEYNFMNIRHKGRMCYKNDKILISPESAQDDNLIFFDFTMKIGDSLNVNGSSLTYTVSLDDIFNDDFMGDTFYQFRIKYVKRIVEPDIVHIVSKSKGIVCIYACFTHRMDGFVVDDIIAFIGYGYFSKLSKNTSRYH
jgi:hypothetical protein